MDTTQTPPKPAESAPPASAPYLLTLPDVEREARKRLSLINKEFTDAFEKVRNYSKSVTFFGSARFTENNPYYIKTRMLAKRIATELGYTVVSGGGPGIMEAANRGAFEGGGESVGFGIRLPAEQNMNAYLTDSYEFHYFFSRKVAMTFSAEAYIVCPGGYGTFNELFEILTLVQTQKIEKVPIILYGADFWKPMHDCVIKGLCISNDTISQEDLDLYTITDNEDEIIEIIRKAPVRIGARS